MRIGAHASVAGGVHHAVAAQVEYGGNCGQIFSRSPQVWREPTIEPGEADEFRERSAETGIGPWIVHSSYLVNLSTPKADLRERSIESVQTELAVADRLGAAFVNVHLGAHTGAGVEAGLDNAVSALDRLQVPDGVRILVESDAGAGTKLGGAFGHLGEVVDRCSHDLGVCLDTAHAWAAGYDVSSEPAVAETIAEFDDAVGIDRLACVHLNDSKHGRGTNRDEHAHVGEGTIGEAGMAAVINHPDLRELPFVLETPTEDGRSFAWNVRRARSLRA